MTTTNLHPWHYEPSDSSDSDDEVIKKLAFPTVTADNTYSRTVTPVANRTLQPKQNDSFEETYVPTMINRARTEDIIALGVKITMQMYCRSNFDEDFGTNKDIFLWNAQTDKTCKVYTNSKSDVPFTTFKVLVYAGVVKEVSTWVGPGQKFRMYYPKSSPMDSSSLKYDMQGYISKYVKHLESDKKWVQKLTTKHAYD